MKQVWEKIVEGILTCSGFITSITIVLIVIFLFTEAFGLFGNKVTEEGYVLAVNGKNPVRELSAVQIKDVFDEEITNWSEVGGPDIGIKVFRLEDITSYFSEEELGAEYDKAGECIGKVVADHPGIIAFVPAKFIEKDFPGRLLKDEHISFSEVFAGKEWFPTATIRFCSFGHGNTLGELLCDSFCIAVRIVCGCIYVGSSKQPHTRISETGY